MKIKSVFLTFCFLIFSTFLKSTTLTVQNTSSSCGQTNVPVYINIDNAAGLLAFQFDIYFDTTKVDFISADKTALTSNFMIQFNDLGSYAKIAASSGVPVSSGSGAIAVLYFNVAATQDGSSLIDIRNSLVNDVPPTEVDGTFTISNCCSNPSGMQNNTSEDLDPCIDTGVQIIWQPPSNWGDFGGNRYFVVLRNGVDISGNLSEWTYIYTDNTGTNGTSYIYQVKAINGCGNTITTLGSSGIDNVYPIPSCSSNPYPPSGSEGLPTSLTLVWNVVSDATSYDLYFGTQSNPPFFITSTNNYYAMQNLSPQTTYFWKIVPKNPCNNAGSCPVWSFKTGKAALSCDASANPSSGSAPLEVKFSSSGKGGVEPYSFLWNFGDGSTSTEQNPSHTYTVPNTYNWSFVLTDSENSTCTKNGVVYVLPVQYSEFFIVPASAHTEGGYGSRWRTNLSLCNFSSSIQNLNIALLKAGQDNSNPQNFDFSLGKNSCFFFEDILWEKFSFEGAGALKISSNSKEITIDSRTYNESTEGTFGQFIPSFEKDEILKKGERGYLRFLIRNQNFRTNIGFSSLSDVPIEVKLEIFSQ
ncbi:MAG: PKD domain-containing protein, partial [Thermoanaerobaculia bacterium]